ncbi:MAG: type I restriction enzyme HsdR N-terminal domain-containing protein [Balneola sp.]|nr:MAG: type I restriction enzyme HsdR N-terminal domain-containing protein [Balneola sp.]
MKSSSTHHFPQVIFRNEEKLLWNPILKKPYKHLPEERVRLAFVEYLMLEAGVSKNRISFESPVRLPGDKGASRTDIVCYNEHFKPQLLVECKAGDVSLNEKTALQIARYNQKVNAPFLLVTNGLTYYWFSRDESLLKQLSELPIEYDSKHEINRDSEYWIKRGFLGKNSSDTVQDWAVKNSQLLYSNSDSSVHYLRFKDSQFELELANYYRIFSTGNGLNLAVAITATPKGGSTLNVVMNRQHSNVGIISVSLDAVKNADRENATLMNEKGITRFDAVQELGFSFDQDAETVFEPIARLSS